MKCGGWIRGRDTAGDQSEIYIDGGETGVGKEETAPRHEGIEWTGLDDWLTVGNEGKGEVKDDSQVFNLSDRVKQEPFTEMVSTGEEAGIRGHCEV